MSSFVEPDLTPGQPAFAGLRRPRPNTPGFEEWFAGSVLVEPDGRPMVAYHGTTVGDDFESFSESDFFGSGTFGKGINLTSSPVDASKYASTDLTINHDLGPKAEVHAYKLTGQNGGPEFSQAYRQERDRLTTNGAGRVLPVFVSMRNPLRISREKLVVPKGMFMLAAAEADIGRDVAEALYERFDHAPDGAVQFGLVEARRASKIYRQIASLKNCDGLIIEPEFAPKGNGARHYLVFSAQQVKSAIGNSGQFDLTSPSLTDSRPAAPANEVSEEVMIQPNVPKAPTVEELQKQLADAEGRFRPLSEKGVRGGPEWDQIAREAAALRNRLFEMTGDYYGRPKVKLVRPSDELLEACYSSPDDVPEEVMKWVKSKSSTLFADASDAVRWARIVGTQGHERFDHGDVTLYRAIGDGAGMDEEIRPGDWVTAERSYAELHLQRSLAGRGQILEITVDGRDVLASPTGNSEEAIYAPYELSGPVDYTRTRPMPAPVEEPGSRPGLVRHESENRSAMVPDPKLSKDNPGGRWLAGKRRYVEEDGLNRFGTPATFGPITGHFDRDVMLPVALLRKLAGQRNEEDVVRERDLRSLVALGQSTGRFPLLNGPRHDQTYNPFVQVDMNGRAWKGEGNHRVMMAHILGWEYVPVTLQYHTGGEAMDGPLSPARVKEYDAAARAAGYTPTVYGGRVHTQQKSADDIEQAVRATLSQAALLEISDTMTAAFSDVGKTSEIKRIVADAVKEIEKGCPRMDLTDTNGNVVARFTFLAEVPEDRTGPQVQDGAIRMVIDLQGRVREQERVACVQALLQEAVELIGDGTEPLKAVLGAESEVGLARLDVHGVGLVAQAEAKLRASGLDLLSNPAHYPWGWESGDSGLSKACRVRDYCSDNDEVTRKVWFVYPNLDSVERELLITDAVGRALDDVSDDLDSWTAVD
jgi:hypothetical protein